MSQQTISVKHNVEMAHRLFLTPGKCEAIHGHSWWITLTLWGEVNSAGILEGIDFGELKDLFRSYLNSKFDHHLLLNSNDPLAGPLHVQDSEGWIRLPGLSTFESIDPTTENLAAKIGHYMAGMCSNKWQGVNRVKVDTWETQVNNATWLSNL